MVAGTTGNPELNGLQNFIVYSVRQSVNAQRTILTQPARKRERPKRLHCKDGPIELDSCAKMATALGVSEPPRLKLRHWILENIS